MAGYRRGAQAAPSRVVHSLSLQERAQHHLSLACAALGCNAITARVMWASGQQLIVADIDVGAAEGDVMRLRRIPTPANPDNGGGRLRR